jgi:dUTP pyrophosphatase
MGGISVAETSKIVKVKRLHPDAVIPQYAHSGDSGFDLVAVEDVIVEPGQTVKVRTGLAFEIPEGYEMQIRPRSGITTKTKLRVQLGTIDSGYRGEVSVMVDNIAQVINMQVCGKSYVRTSSSRLSVDGREIWVLGDKPQELLPIGTYLIRKGDRIGQAVIVPVIHAEITEVDELTDTERGSGGFGSTGA